MDTLDLQVHEAVEIGNIGRKIQSYLVEQIFMENSIYSGSNSSSQDGSGTDSSGESDEQNTDPT